MLGMCTLPRSCWARSAGTTVLVLSTLHSFADANSWLKPTSGNWEEPYWSQGILPNYGHAVMITNAGWKAVQIAPSTAQYYPDSLTVYSITVASPVDSYNSLLLNYAGFDRPVTANYNITVGPNAAITMFSSALRLNGPPGVGLSIGGEFNQNDSSHVYGNQADVGWVGPGVYNFNSGTIDLQHLFVGGPNHGIFNHNGGSNATRIVHLESGGEYNFRDGDFNGEVYFGENAIFRQDGGRLHSPLTIFRGQYILNGGVNFGDVTIPVYAEYQNGDAAAYQNGGTSLGSIYLGGQGSGSYIISNGVVQAPTIAVRMGGAFRQAGGTVSTPSALNVRGGSCCRGQSVYAYFNLDGGALSSTGMDVALASATQTGGTNQLAGDLTISFPAWYGSSRYTLNGGLLTASNTIVSWPQGGFVQNGGTHRIANQLTISESSSAYDVRGYVLNGGQLIVPNIVVSGRARFERSGGTLTQTGTITLISSHIYAGPGTQQFGALGLGTLVPSYNSLETNSTLHMPSDPSIVRFRNSAAQVWPADATLVVTGWNGSQAGGGSHRIIFGNSSAALTSQQLAKIFFRTPGGLAYGTYQAKILPTGEIVPDGLPPTGHNPSRLAIRKLPDSTVQITVTADPGYNYGVLTSTDLATWNLWTNRVATNGTFTVVDPNSVEWWPYRRFYKAVLMQ